MATVSNYANHAPTSVSSKVQQVISILRWTYGLVPMVAGADKFMHILANWDKYLAPVVTRIVQIPAHTFMSIVGVIEIIAGVMVLIKPRIGSLIVGCWLIGIAINLVLTGEYYDIAVRDTVIALGAFCLHMLLSEDHES